MKHFTCDICKAPLGDPQSWEDTPWLISNLCGLEVQRFAAAKADGKIHACSFACAVNAIDKWIKSERERMQAFERTFAVADKITS